MLHEHDKEQLSSSSEIKKYKASSTTKAKQHETLRTSTSTSKKAHVVFFTTKVPSEQHHETSSTQVKASEDTTTEQHRTTKQHQTTLHRETTLQHQTPKQHQTIQNAKPTSGIFPAGCDCGELASPCPCSTSKFNPIPMPKQQQSETSDTKHAHPLPTIPMEGTSIKSIVSTTTAAGVTTTGAASGGQTSGGTIPQVAGHPKSTMIAIVVPVVLVFVFGALGAVAIWWCLKSWRRRDRVKSWFEVCICGSSRRKHVLPDTTETTRNAGYQNPTQPQPHAVRGFDKHFDEKVNDWVLKPNRTPGLPYEGAISGPAPIYGSAHLIPRKSVPRMQRYGEENPYIMNGIPLYQAGTR